MNEIQRNRCVLRVEKSGKREVDGGEEERDDKGRRGSSICTEGSWSKSRLRAWPCRRQFPWQDPVPNDRQGGRCAILAFPQIRTLQVALQLHQDAYFVPLADPPSSRSGGLRWCSWLRARGAP